MAHHSCNGPRPLSPRPRHIPPPLTYVGLSQYIIVEQNNIAIGGCEQMKAVQDYVWWILASPQAASIAHGLLWAAMPEKIATLAVDILRSMACISRSSLNPAISSARFGTGNRPSPTVPDSISRCRHGSARLALSAEPVRAGCCMG